MHDGDASVDDGPELGQGVAAAAAADLERRGRGAEGSGRKNGAKDATAWVVGVVVAARVREAAARKHAGA